MQLTRWRPDGLDRDWNEQRWWCDTDRRAASHEGSRATGGWNVEAQGRADTRSLRQRPFPAQPAPRVRAGSFASLRLAKDGWAIAETGTDRWSSVIRGSDPKGPEPLSFSGSAGFREGDPTPTALFAVGTVEDFLEHFVEHSGEASCPKCGKPCAGDDALGRARLAVHRVSRGACDRPAEQGGGVDERTDPADQAGGRSGTGTASACGTRSSSISADWISSRGRSQTTRLREAPEKQRRRGNPRRRR